MKKKIIAIVIVTLMISSICFCCFTIFQQTLNIIRYAQTISESCSIVGDFSIQNIYYYLFSSIFAIVRDIVITSCIIVFGLALLHIGRNELFQEIECQILARVDITKEKIKAKKVLKKQARARKNLLEYQKKKEKLQQKLDKLNTQENE